MAIETETRVTGGDDTHRDENMIAALDQRDAKLGVQPFPTNLNGYRQTLRWLESFGPIDRVGVEGTGTYGAGLTRFLERNGVAVVEVTCADHHERRSHGKSDPVNAIAAARSAQSGNSTAEPKTLNGNVEAIRVLRPYAYEEWSADQP